MRISFNPDVLQKITFLIGTSERVRMLSSIPVRMSFDEEVINFLNDVSRKIMKNKLVKHYSDVMTFAFWIRRSSINQLKKRFAREEGSYRFGRGTVFHITPSNVPVNFAYSMVSGLLAGNTNIVRVPTNEYKQIDIIINAIENVLNSYADLKSYVILIRYVRDREVNDLLSAISDVRIIWGGDATVNEIRKSALPPRSIDITFADRYSIAVIDADAYLLHNNKSKIALDFYNDTFFSDQNACTSPQIVIWIGEQIEEAKEIFWEEEHKIVKQKYDLKSIQAVNKLISSCLTSVAFHGCKVEKQKDNLIVRIRVAEARAELMDYRGNSGFFFEYDCSDIMEIRDLCNDTRCQTVGYIGKKDLIYPLIYSGIKGIDRIVPIGKTMDFDLIWDGYDLISNLTRQISIV